MFSTLQATRPVASASQATVTSLQVMPCSTSPSAEPIFHEEASRPSCIRSERGSSSWTMPPLSIRAMEPRLRLAMRSSQIHSHEGPHGSAHRDYLICPDRVPELNF